MPEGELIAALEREAKRYRGELEIAKAEIATLTEQRDRVMKALRNIAEGNGVPDSLLVSKDAFREGFAPFLQKIARAALDIPSSPSLPESPEAT